MASFWFYPLLLTFIVILMNGPALGHTFRVDDWYILWDHLYQGLGGKLFWFGWGYVRPGGLLTWKLLYHFFGLNALPYYAFATLLQVANAWLVYSIVKRLLDSRLLALGAGVIFVTYYLNAEATLWLASAFFDVQSAFFMLLTFRLFLELSRSDYKKSYQFWLIAATTVICYLLAVFTKETGLFVLPVCVGYEIWYARLWKRVWWRTLALYTALLLVVASFLIAHNWPEIKLPIGELSKPDQLPSNIVYHLKGLYLLPVMPYNLSDAELWKAQLALGVWLLPALLVFFYITFVASAAKLVKSLKKTRPALLETPQASQPKTSISLKVLINPASRLLVLGLGWTIVTSLATVSINYTTMRFLYVPHIGVALSAIAIIAILIEWVQSLNLTRTKRWLAYSALVYILGILSIAGILGFGVTRRYLATSDKFTQQLVTVVQQQIQAGATDIRLVNLPRVIDPQDIDDFGLFINDLTPKLIIRVKLGLDLPHVQVVRTGDTSSLGYEAIGDVVTPIQATQIANGLSIITAQQTSTGSFILGVTH